eukprot:3965821-Pyramimonas_sp.AAC.1
MQGQKKCRCIEFDSLPDYSSTSSGPAPRAALRLHRAYGPAAAPNGTSLEPPPASLASAPCARLARRGRVPRSRLGGAAVVVR